MHNSPYHLLSSVFRQRRRYASLQFAIFFLLSSCAQQGNITGGPKDEKPPEVVSSKPSNFTTQFKSVNIEITFNEFFSLKDIAKQLVVSPPMVKKPEFFIKGKTLKISLKDTLQPDRTYALNFGDALIDLNEGNPIKNFSYVFSTGSTIDSLQAGGRVLQASDNKPAEDILVMLFSGNADSLPLKTIPLYISRTDKEGRFTLKNLAGGSYKIFALKDGNTNYRFDLPTEAVAFLDSLITPTVVANPDTVSVKMAKDSLSPVRDTANLRKDSAGLAKDSSDSLPEKPKFLFKPDSIKLHLFTEAKPNQYLTGTDRLRPEQFRLKFNNKPDSLGFEFMGLPTDSVAVSLEWLGDPDTLDFWVLNKAMAARDSITAILVYTAYDSLERPYAKIDTVKLRYRSVQKPATAQKNEFTVLASVEKNKMLEYGQRLTLTTSLPYLHMDTSLIHLVSGKDSTARKVRFKMIPDTLKGLVVNGLPICQVHPRIINLDGGFSADTSYRLTLLPGAFLGFAGQKNDTLDIRFKMKNKDQYGTLKIDLPDLKGPAIIQLIDSRSKIAATRLQNGSGTAVFDLIVPGKYSVRLIFDDNRNGRWDTGRYTRHIQPEKVISFTKELNLKANWEVSETW
ncbi:MAG: Ig-like domain-containing protein, partial [Bacteroidia bacterium]|nr:Ig-like domain-containing protein [Bacteroidia bacterium]